jgi:hypothetical protein
LLIKNKVAQLLDSDWLTEWWHIDDIKGVRPDLSDEDARAVLRVIDRLVYRRDASIGVNWDFIETVADSLFPKPNDDN